MPIDVTVIISQKPNCDHYARIEGQAFAVTTDPVIDGRKESAEYHALDLAHRLFGSDCIISWKYYIDISKYFYDKDMERYNCLNEEKPEIKNSIHLDLQ